ncbi:MAG: cysteine--tRNA ligase, partial [Chloroflexi bacterium]|nr:cysteine--tRNA ligase [Chloroflexota bacterium]
MRLYNTMSRRVEEVKQPDDALKIYVCGITPYDHSHVGHAMSYIIFDVLRRYLEYRGFKVKHVQNYTDIDDRIIARAAERGVSYDQLAATYIEEYEEEMRELNIMPADVYPRATQEIPQIIEMVQGLIDKGRAYVAENGDVYFDVRSDPGYGKLSGRDVDSMRAGARVQSGEEKRDPADFALWKAAKPGEPSWDSPWGPGRPGWHIECSAMSYRYLGPTLDMHGGGQDLIFPHHENEIAQAEGFTGVKPFVRHWLHNGWLTLDEEKMSKSLGNIITIREALERYGSDGIRIFVMTAHYRAPLAYSEEAMEAGKRAAERLHLAASVPGGDGPAADIPGDEYRQRFTASMDDDLNTAGALACLFDLAREINRARDEGRAVDEAQATLRE